MWCRYVDVNNLGWSKSSSEGNRFFLCVVFHLRQKDGTSVRCMSESRCRGEKHARGTWGKRRTVTEHMGRGEENKSMKRSTESDGWRNVVYCWNDSWKERRWKRRDAAMEGEEDDTNGFWARCIQLLRKTWIKHSPGHSSRTGYGASH